MQAYSDLVDQWTKAMRVGAWPRDPVFLWGGGAPRCCCPTRPACPRPGASQEAEDLDFGTMFRDLHEVEHRTAQLTEAAQQLHEALHPAKCTKRRQLHVGGGSGLGLFGLYAIGGGGFLLAWASWARGRKAKPKIN